MAILYDGYGNPINIGSEVSKFKDRKIVWLGDSIHAYGKETFSDVPYLFQYYYGAKCYNWCQGGTTMAKMGIANYDPFSGVGMVDCLTSGDFSTQETYMEDRGFTTQVTEMKAFDFSKAEYVIIEFGTNDALKEVTLDNSEDKFDTTTTGGALRYMIKTLLTYNPKLKIIVLNVQKMSGWLDNEHQKSYDSRNQNEVINSVCEELCIPCIDMYHLLGLNDYTSTTLLSDNLHRSYVGKLKQVQIIENQMNYYF